jgi:hypothetical protein
MIALYIIGGLILWIAIGLLTLRIACYLLGAPPREEENFYLGLAVFGGPMFTASILIVAFFVFAAWVIKGSFIPTFLRKVAGLDG